MLKPHSKYRTTSVSITVTNKYVKTMVLSLNPLNIEGYPMRKKEPESLLTNAYCIQIIDDMEELLRWIENKLLE